MSPWSRTHQTSVHIGKYFPLKAGRNFKSLILVMANRTPVLIFVLLLIALYLLLTYSYAGYTPNFPQETRNRDLYYGPGFVLESDSVADRAVEKEF